MVGARRRSSILFVNVPAVYGFWTKPATRNPCTPALALPPNQHAAPREARADYGHENRTLRQRIPVLRKNGRGARRATVAKTVHVEQVLRIRDTCPPAN